MQTEKEADDPRPAPMGSVDRALRLNEGLRVHIVSPYFQAKQSWDVITSLPRAPASCIGIRMPVKRPSLSKPLYLGWTSGGCHRSASDRVCHCVVRPG